MRTLYTWLEPNDVRQFAAKVDPSLKSGIDQWLDVQVGFATDRTARFPLFEQMLFSCIYLFYCSKMSFVHELKQWLRPGLELISLEINNLGDGNEIQEKTRQKIMELSNGNVLNNGILRTCSNSVIQQALAQVDIPGLINYTVVDGQLQEDPSDKTLVGNFVTALKPKGLEGISGTSPLLATTLYRAEKARQSQEPVLITGESGTGKKYLAHAIAQQSDKIEILRGLTLNHSKLDVELTGTAQIPGILKTIDNGTLILADIDQCTLPTQLQLFNVLQHYQEECCIFRPHAAKVNDEISSFWLIATSSRNLLEMVKNHEFLSELYFLLAVITIETTPLRDRPEDISWLAYHFLDEINRQSHARYLTISTDGWKGLARHCWPGNISELKQVIHQAAVFAPSTIIQRGDLPIMGARPSMADLGEKSLGAGFDLKKEIDNFQRDYIKRALRQAHGQKKVAANLLGMKSYQALDSKMKALKISE